MFVHVVTRVSSATHSIVLQVPTVVVPGVVHNLLVMGVQVYILL